MKSIFFPFEQMVNFIDYHRRNNSVFVTTLTIILLVLCYYINFYFAIAFLISMMLYILTIYIKSNKKTTSKETSGIFYGFVFCVFLAIIYDFTTKYYNEELDITSYWLQPHPFSGREKVRIFSGEKPGNYYNVMTKVKEYDSIFQTGVPESSGGYDNPSRVMLNAESIGFVQEGLYTDDDNIKGQVDYVVPLYNEKLHIIYDKKSPVFKDLVANEKQKYFSLGFNDDTLIAALMKCNIGAGRVGSATKMISSKVLSQMSGGDKSNSKVANIVNAPLDEEMERLRGALPGKSKLDVVFFISGQPVTIIRDLLKKRDSFGLIGIEPSFINAINRANGTQFRTTDFSVKGGDSLRNNALGYGEDYNSLPTLGSKCYLIANKKVKPYLIKRFINDLNEIKGSLNLDFLNFWDNFNASYQAKQKKIFASLLIALTGGVALGTVILSFIFALVSSFRHDKISNKLAAVITRIPDDSIPSNEDAEKDRDKESLNLLSDAEKEKQIVMFNKYYEEKLLIEPPMRSPYIRYFQIEIINKNIVDGLSRLVELRREINNALNNGQLNTEHFNDLLARTDSIMDKLRKGLFLRLHELFQRPIHLGGIEIKNEQIGRLLLKYVTSNYLNFDDYRKLIN